MKKETLISDIKNIENVLAGIRYASFDAPLPEKYVDDIRVAYQCTSLTNQFNLLNKADIESLKSQIVDKVDLESLEELNMKRFFDYPINLPYLL